jgi:hypothetical protein
MAKELPYFKFEPNQWENGNIQMFSREDKGLFIDLCSMYWSRLGDVPLKLAIQKLCAGNATAFDSLIKEGIFTVENDFVCIDFLNEQLSDFEDTSKQNSKNAKERWEKYRKLKAESERNATALIPQCENDAIREEEIREDKSRKEISFERFWDLYAKKVDLEKSKAKFLKLSDKDIDLILGVVEKYVLSTPDKQYRKNPLTWLNGKCWNDIIQDTKGEPKFSANFQHPNKPIAL